MAKSSSNSEGEKPCRRGFEPEDPGLKRRLNALMTASTGASLLAIAADWIILLAAAIASWLAFQFHGITVLPAGIYSCAALLIASRQRGMENLLHEATHKHLSSNPRLNDAIAWYLALPLGHCLPMERRSHMKGHHSHFWDGAYDPDFQRYIAMGLHKLPVASPWQLLAILVRGLPIYFCGAVRAFFFPPGEPALLRLVRAGFWLIVVVLVLTTGVIVPFVIYWLVPFVIVLTPLRYIAELSEHSAMGCSSEFGTTRNNIGWVQRYFLHPHGDGFHLVHHLYPGVPFYNLARVHALLMQDPVYRSAGRHCYGLILTSKGCHSTLADLTNRTEREPQTDPQLS